MLAEMYQERGDFPAARRLLGTALERDPHAAATLCALGSLELRSGAPTLAADYASRCIQSNPVFPDSWYLLGLAFDASGDRPRAVRALQRQLEIVPGHELARERLRVLSAQ
jgi:tetratricopeptide (TPR) repeat protein